MTRYRKKPIEVEAIQYTGDNGQEIADFMHVPVPELQTHVDAVLRTDGDYRKYNHIYINTPEGTITANCGDYIIKGVKGEFYPCKPDIFDETYEVIEGEGMTEMKLIDRIKCEMMGLLASMPYDLDLNDMQLSNEIRKAKALMMDGLDLAISPLAIVDMVRGRCPPIWESAATPGKTWVIGPDTGKGVDMEKINEEMRKELEEYEKREKE